MRGWKDKKKSSDQFPLSTSQEEERLTPSENCIPKSQSKKTLYQFLEPKRGEKSSLAPPISSTTLRKKFAFRTLKEKGEKWDGASRILVRDAARAMRGRKDGSSSAASRLQMPQSTTAKKSCINIHRVCFLLLILNWDFVHKACLMASQILRWGAGDKSFWITNIENWMGGRIPAVRVHTPKASKQCVQIWRKSEIWCFLVLETNLFS